MASFSFTGDIAFSKHFHDHWQKDFLDPKITDFLTHSDHVVANVECPLSASEITNERKIIHSCTPEAAGWFRTISADIWTLANNHILDCGEVGMTDTIACAHQNGAVTIGAGRNFDEASKYVSFDCNGGIGMFSVTYKRGEFIRATETNAGCVLLDDPNTIHAIISEIKAKHRWCVVIAHGGDEFCNLPMPYMRKLYRSFLKMGADVVVGHHPHVVQNYETVGKKMIFYSLGNFVFDTNYQRQQKYTEYGILLKLHFNDDDFTWEYLPTRINRETQTVEAAAEPPHIFCNVDNKTYRRLWPLAAKHFVDNFATAKRFVYEETRSYNAFQWFNRHRKKLGLKDARCLYRGKALYWLRLWKLGNKDLRTYLEEK